MTRTLRRGTAADIPALIDMIARDFPALLNLRFSREKATALFLRLLDRSPFVPRTGFLYVLDVDGEPVGFLAAEAVTGEPWTDDRIAIEHMLFVKPEHRGRDAVRLIKEYLRWAKKIGCKAVRLTAQNGLDGERVGALYRRLGFRPLESTFVHSA